MNKSLRSRSILVSKIDFWMEFNSVNPSFPFRLVLIFRYSEIIDSLHRSLLLLLVVVVVVVVVVIPSVQ